MRINKTLSPLNIPFNIVTSITFPIIFLLTNLVLLQSLGSFMFRNKILNEQIFRRKLCDGNPDKSIEFKNSVG